MQPHLVPPTPPDHLYLCHATCLSFTTSVCHATCPSVNPPAPSIHPHVTQSVCHMDMSVCHTTSQSVCQSTHKSVTLSVHTTASPSIIPIHPSYAQSVLHPVNSSMTRQSSTPPISPKISLSGCPTSSDRSSNLYMPNRLYDNPLSLSACPSPSNCLTATMTRPSVRLSSNTIHHTQDSSQSLAIVNGSNPARPRNSVGPLLTMT